jgi:hypothetical protein
MLSRARRILIRLAFVGFACRALVPVGFMPAALGDGGPIKVCHGGLASELFRSLAEMRSAHAHTGHDHSSALADHGQTLDSSEDGHDRTDHAGWEHCSIGAAFAYAALIADIHFHFHAPEHSFDRIESSQPVAPIFVGSYHARAPPTV